MHIFIGMNVSSAKKLGMSAALLIPLTMLSGCQREAKISVMQNGETVTFSVAETNGDPACVDKIKVTDAAARTTLWSLSRTMAAAQNGRCEHEFSYGAASNNYEILGTIQPLVGGKSYEVSVAGNGYIASKTKFTFAP